MKLKQIADKQGNKMKAAKPINRFCSQNSMPLYNLCCSSLQNSRHFGNLNFGFDSN